MRVDGKEALGAVARMPVYTWNAKGTDPGVRRMGPTAQDFFAAFHLGDSDRLISSGDAEGVALAAIQGLNQVDKEMHGRLERVEKENSALKARLERVEAMLATAGQTRAAGGGGERRSDLGFGLLGLGMLAVGGGVVVARRRRAS